ncbi:beta-1,4-N-acetylgalactosaminyltransferase bre-4-like [Artemia franciscana]|uniref:Beta-1,4-N-acetylgalactosaminyltransferase n=1 Tax=Artemia franciscana TaxID=6661 RepID=A0AA88HTN9_ARTSF|nr:hypothetical protein QYM36_010223 [Artemia franciscana]
MIEVCRSHFYKIILGLVCALTLWQLLVLQNVQERVFIANFQYNISNIVNHFSSEKVSNSFSLPKETRSAGGVNFSSFWEPSNLYLRNETEFGNSSYDLCPETPINLDGHITVLKTSPTLEELESHITNLMPGGRFKPFHCKARHKVAIVVPYRDRKQHLAVFLQHLHPFLQKQELDYGIYVVEQIGKSLFNRAMLMNIGAAEALRQYDYQCFIFHDVDLLPEDDRNIYSCPEMPRHMSVAVDVFDYKLPYQGLFGGVSAMNRSHFEKVNGFSNMFWGWGGEDDDMSNRIRYKKLLISRYPANIARYVMLSHSKAKPNPSRFRVMKNGAKRAQVDGLKNLRYKRVKIQFMKLCTWISVDISPKERS